MTASSASVDVPGMIEVETTAVSPAALGADDVDDLYERASNWGLLLHHEQQETQAMVA